MIQLKHHLKLILVQLSMLIFKLKYRATGSSSWTWRHINGNTDSLIIDNLNISTNYEFKIRTTCFTGSSSNWSSTFLVKTKDILGCMNSRAINFNPSATLDDGSCSLSCLNRNGQKI